MDGMLPCKNWHTQQRCRPQVPRGTTPCSSLGCPKSPGSRSPAGLDVWSHQDLPAMGHLEEHREAIGADEQVAGRRRHGGQ